MKTKKEKESKEDNKDKEEMDDSRRRADNEEIHVKK